LNDDLHKNRTGEPDASSDSGPDAPRQEPTEGAGRRPNEVTSAERSALVEPSGSGPWWAAFPHRYSRFRPDASRVAMAVFAGLTAVLLAAGGLTAHAFADRPAVMAALATIPTLLALLWALALRRRFAGAATVLLTLLLMLIPLNLVLATFGLRDGMSLPLLSSITVVVLLLSLAASRLLHVPAAFAVAAALTALAVLNPLVATADMPRPWHSDAWLLLALFAAGTLGMASHLRTRRQEVNQQIRLGGKLAFVALAWSLAVCLGVMMMGRDGARAAGVIDPHWAGPWSMALAAVVTLCGLAFARSPGPGRKSPSRSFGIVLIVLAGIAAAAGLAQARCYPVAMLVNLGIIFAVTFPLGAFIDCKGRKAFQALASIAVPAAGAWAAMILGGPYPAHLGGDGGVPVTAIVGLSIGALVTYFVGLLPVLKARHWTHSVPSVAGMALGLLGFVGLALTGGTAQITVPASDIVLTIPAVPLMLVMALGILVTAWRIHWQPAVYLAALGLLVTLGSYADARAGRVHGSTWVLTVAVWVAVTGTALALAGGVLAVAGRKVLLARFYSEGLLIMGLAATTITVLAAAAGVSSVAALFTDEMICLLAALAIALLVSSLTFRQEDLFGFFGFILLLLAVVSVGVRWPYAGGSYVARWQTSVLGSSVVLAVAAWRLAVRFGDRKGLQHFGAALYVVAFVAALIGLSLLPLTRHWYWRGYDLVAVAVVLSLIRPHVRHPATGYAVAAAVVAAIFQFVAGRWGHSATEMHQASVIAAGAISVAMVLAAHLLRHVLLVFTRASDKEARRRSRPFTVVGMTLAVALSAYLAVQTALAYHSVWSGRVVLPSLTQTFTPGAGLVAWVGALLAFLVSIWLFRHSARTLAFYLIGSLAVIGVGPVLFGDPDALLAYFIFAIGGYGAMHLLVYLRERPYMMMLSRICALYKDEQHASTTIFTAGAVSCFIGATIAAFYIHTLAALGMFTLLSGVFFAWAFGQRRAEFIYPLVLTSVGMLLSVWHNFKGPGPWTPDRININALIFVAGAPLWMGIGTALNRLRGPAALLNAPARWMSVILALTGLGFFIALAVSPTWEGFQWQGDDSVERFAFLGLSGVGLVAFFLWAAASFRSTVLVYLAETSLLVLAVAVATRLPAGRHSEIVRDLWPVGVAGLSLAVLGIGHWLERRRHILHGRALYYSAVLLLPVVALAGAAASAMAGRYGLASITCFVVGATIILGTWIRTHRWMVPLALLAAAGGVAGPLVSGEGFGIEAAATAAGMAVVTLVRVVSALRRRKRR
jgi:hypothetical protein